MTPESDRPTVLYVEDHPVNVTLMRAVFARHDRLDLVVAACCADALELAPNLTPALLLLDLQLPDGHGSQLLQQLREFPGFGAAPAVAVTANHEFPFLAHGFVELWPKPMDLRVVFDRLDGIVASAADGPGGPRWSGSVAGALGLPPPDAAPAPATGPRSRGEHGSHLALMI